MLTFSPSDLTFLWDDCPRCFWLKAKGLKPSREALPAVFNDIDKGMKQGVSVEHLRELGIPARAFIKGDFVECAPFEAGGATIRLRGFTDRACWLEDDTVAVIDYKTTGGNEERIGRYWRQLSAYRRCLEHPAKGAAVEVSGLVIVAFTPSAFTVAKDGRRCAHTGVLTPHVLDMSREAFLMFMAEVGEVAKGEEMPPSGAWCGVCKHVREVAERTGLLPG